MLALDSTFILHSIAAFFSFTLLFLLLPLSDQSRISDYVLWSWMHCGKGRQTNQRSSFYITSPDLHPLPDLNWNPVIRRAISCSVPSTPQLLRWDNRVFPIVSLQTLHFPCFFFVAIQFGNWPWENSVCSHRRFFVRGTGVLQVGDLKSLLEKTFFSEF